MAVETTTRLLLMLLCTGVALARGDLQELWWAPLLLVAGWRRLRAHQPAKPWALGMGVLEGALLGGALVTTGSADSPYLPYLLMPAFSGGLSFGLLAGLLPSAAAVAALVITPLYLDSRPFANELSAHVFQWLVLAVLVAIVASWVQSVLHQAARVDALERSQIEAFRLLTELREVARQLPGTLDPGSTAEVLLERVHEQLPGTSAAVVVGGRGRVPRLLAQRGAPAAAWDLQDDPNTAVARGWDASHAILLPGGINGREEDGARPGLLLPLKVAGEVFALLLVESPSHERLQPSTIDALREMLTPLLLPLRSALVFDEVREGATREERRRLAREIHDGIAQELASLGYALDGVHADLAVGRPAAEQVDEARRQIRRVLSELRQSMFDLRSDVGPGEGIGAAIGRYVRTVGASAGLTVHLSLNESSGGLGPEVEAELLRIVQEAVTNARKHANATTLWVTCSVDPPGACIVVEDDGDGIQDQPSRDNHGLAIMRERATRIRATVVVEGRAPRGTRVQVSLGMVPP
jgi:signal transduction histidine kinase